MLQRKLSENTNVICSEWKGKEITNLRKQIKDGNFIVRELTNKFKTSRNTKTRTDNSKERRFELNIVNAYKK